MAAADLDDLLVVLKRNLSQEVNHFPVDAIADFFLHLRTQPAWMF